MLNNLNNNDENIITKSQIYEKVQLDKVIDDSFAKTINYYGIHSNFCLDIPEIIACLFIGHHLRGVLQFVLQQFSGLILRKGIGTIGNTTQLVIVLDGMCGTIEGHAVDNHFRCHC